MGSKLLEMAAAAAAVIIMAAAAAAADESSLIHLNCAGADNGLKLSVGLDLMSV